MHSGERFANRRRFANRGSNRQFPAGEPRFGQSGWGVGGGGFRKNKLVLGPLDLFRHFLTFFDLFSWIYPIYSSIYD